MTQSVSTSQLFEINYQHQTISSIKSIPHQIKLLIISQLLQLALQDSKITKLSGGSQRLGHRIETSHNLQPSEGARAF